MALKHPCSHTCSFRIIKLLRWETSQIIQSKKSFQTSKYWNYISRDTRTCFGVGMCVVEAKIIQINIIFHRRLLNCMALAISHKVASYCQFFSLQLNKSKGRTGRKGEGSASVWTGSANFRQVFLWLSFTDPTPVAVTGKDVFINTILNI